MNSPPLYRTAEYVTAGHLLAILLVMLAPLISRLWPRARPDLVMPIDFVVDVTPRGVAMDAEPEAPAPRPEAPEAVARPEPAPTARPDVKPDPPKPRPQIERSTTRVRRTLDATPGKPEGLTPEEIRRRLAMGARPGTHNSAIPSDAAMHFGRIYRALYEAWTQPSAAAVGRSTVTAELRFATDGRIVGRKLLNPSGIPEFDRSVERALNAVDRVPGLPVSFLEQHRVVTVLFEVQG